mmetsp:Transcript_104294/g.164548  ORF Transcript_104294/g.164548 Transcript_104294/m.164548 type:complete len:324 (+) Transcript_104294:36-1007(+)
MARSHLMNVVVTGCDGSKLEEAPLLRSWTVDYIREFVSSRIGKTIERVLHQGKALRPDAKLEDSGIKAGSTVTVWVGEDCEDFNEDRDLPPRVEMPDTADVDEQIFIATEKLKQGKGNKKRDVRYSYLCFRAIVRSLQGILNSYHKQKEIQELWVTANVYCITSIPQIEKLLKQSDEKAWWLPFPNFAEDHQTLENLSLMDLLLYHSECILRFDASHIKALIRWSWASLNREECDEQDMQHADALLRRAADEESKRKAKLQAERKTNENTEPIKTEKKTKQHPKFAKETVISYESTYELLQYKRKKTMRQMNTVISLSSCLAL